MQTLGYLLGIVLCITSCTSPEQRFERRTVNRLDTDTPVRVVYSDRIYGQYSRSDYSGTICKDEDSSSRSSRDDDGSCSYKCRQMYNEHSRECENVPAELVNQLYEFFKNMRRIRQPQSLDRQVDIMNFGVMIDLDIEPALELIADWSSRETALFLIWVAEQPSVALAIQHHDPESIIMQRAFENLGSEYSHIKGKKEKVLAGFSEDLRGFTDTFLSIAQDRSQVMQRQWNEAAFVIAHRALEQVCNDKTCIVRAYCARETYDRLLNVGRCPYQTPGRLAGSSSNHCYVHGAEVWSLWAILNSDNQLDSKKITFDRTYKIDQAKCNSAAICGNKAKGPCERDFD